MLAAIMCGCLGPAASSSSPQSTPLLSPPPISGCRAGLPEAGVHNPDRLQVLDPCRHAAGIVVDVAHEDDGDYHLWFTPDPAYVGLMNSENHFQAKPAMLAEITPGCPADSNPADAHAASLCPRSNLPIPVIGNHISIDGPWVLDTDHGWREIHPVGSIQIG
ncbi:MAG: hypothetical protein ACREOM_09255 [Candidatus Dormibacteraceae bacterium]